MVLDWVSKKLNTVSRSSFCAELRNQLEAAQSSIHLSAALEENCGRVKCPNELRMRQDTGRLRTPIVLCGDNKGVYTATSAHNPQTPAEPTLTAHIKSLRSFVDKGLITAMAWIDNRDMVADALTKGKTRRNELLALLNKGYWKVVNETWIWPKRSATTKPS